MRSFSFFALCAAFCAAAALPMQANADAAAAPVAAAAVIQPYALSCEAQENPLGLDETAPLFAWKLQADKPHAAKRARAQVQSGYEIVVSEPSGNPVWQTGAVASDAQLQIPYTGTPLRPFTRYSWKVRVRDGGGAFSAWSSPAFFETAMLSAADWKARWIGDGSRTPANQGDLFRDSPAPLFRKTFDISANKKVQSARLHITGLGYYEASINGRRIGDTVLAPAWTNYGKHVFYDTFDVTAELQSGKNALGVVLGNGWFNPIPMPVFRALRNVLTIGRPCLLAQLHVRYTDGSQDVVVSDETWKTAPGPILRNNVYLGEHHDARREIHGWDVPAFDDAAWRPATSADTAPKGRLLARVQPPIRATKTLQPAKISEPQKGVFIYDFGQNFAGVIRLKVRGPAGAKITFRYGEDVYRDGSINVMTSVAGQQKRGGRNAPRESAAQAAAAGRQPPTAWQEDSYTLRGDTAGEVWQPRFTFHGFRYAEVTGAVPAKNAANAATIQNAPEIISLEGIRLNANLAPTGSFDASDPLLKRIETLLDWTFLSNVFSVQSDCPAREKYGYGGDIVATARTFCWFYDMGNFYRKVLLDFAVDQRPRGGMTETAPYNAIADSGLGDGSGPIGWQLAFAFLQKQLYEYYGDTRSIERSYPALLKQVEFLRSRAKGGLFIENCINDHESLERRIPALFATAHYYHHIRLLAEFATITKRDADAEKYTALAGQVKDAFVKRFVNANTGEVANHTQAAQAFGLFYDLLPNNKQDAAFAVLLREIEKRKGHAAAGIFGVPLVFDALNQRGRNDVAYAMVAKKDFPGWGHMLQSGATTLWETWKYSDNTYSQNHPMFGSVGEWFYQGLLGIDTAGAGFKKIILKPRPIRGLSWARGIYDSVRGPISVHWETTDGTNGTFRLRAGIPPNTTAEIWLPASKAAAVTENGIPAVTAKGLRLLREENGAVVFEVGSGDYDFLVK
ncbi:MAG: glycoside hydrolase family 78 protein [Puniceicoccales bacterium]|nr:glycoside hydrolase family 78 protein [Puniceicoccales bacterium]